MSMIIMAMIETMAWMIITMMTIVMIEVMVVISNFRMRVMMMMMMAAMKLVFQVSPYIALEASGEVCQYHPHDQR